MFLPLSMLLLYFYPLSYVILCYVMLCYVMLCYVMLCYVMLFLKNSLKPVEFEYNQIVFRAIFVGKKIRYVPIRTYVYYKYIYLLGFKPMFIIIIIVKHKTILINCLNFLKRVVLKKKPVHCLTEILNIYTNTILTVLNLLSWQVFTIIP